MPLTTQKSTSMLFMKKSRLIFGTATDGTDYAAECESIRIEPAGEPTRFQGLKPDAVWSDPTRPYNLVITFGENYAEATSFANYLWDQDGKTVNVIVEPVEGGSTFAGPVHVVAGGVGGAQGAVAKSSVTLLMPVKPTRTVKANPTT